MTTKSKSKPTHLGIYPAKEKKDLCNEDLKTLKKWQSQRWKDFALLPDGRINSVKIAILSKLFTDLT